MSIPAIKVPRYIVFVIPSLILIASISIWSVSRWMSEKLEFDSLTPGVVSVVALAPLLFFSYQAGLANVSLGGFAEIEPAGDWIDQNVPESARIAASSPAQLRFYAYPRMSYMINHDNESEFRSFVVKKNISYVVVDTYERAQSSWSQTSIPPYRIPNPVRIQLQRGQISGQEAFAMFSQPPGYLEPIQSFGRTQMPLTNQEQPVVIVYRVNRSGL
jgi:hypothetical protein